MPFSVIRAAIRINHYSVFMLLVVVPIPFIGSASGRGPFPRSISFAPNPLSHVLAAIGFCQCPRAGKFIMLPASLITRGFWGGSGCKKLKLLQTIRSQEIVSPLLHNAKAFYHLKFTSFCICENKFSPAPIFTRPMFLAVL